jgi:hypothetical protein
VRVRPAIPEQVGEMERVGGPRRDHLGVLRGPPALDPMAESTVVPVTHRRVDEVRQLLWLVDRGLLSEEEFEGQLLKVYRARW